MKLAFVCQSFNQDDPIQATTVRWVCTLAGKPGITSVHVLALRVGHYEVPHNVSVQPFGGSGRRATLWAFCRAAIKLARTVDGYFIYQGGPYPLLLAPLRWLLGKALFQWKAHPRIDLITRIGAKSCNHRVFTSTRQAFPADYASVRIVGQGVDVERFAPQAVDRIGDLVSVGRIAPVKRIDQMIETVGLLRDRHGLPASLNLYGPCLDLDAGFQQEMEALAQHKGVADLVRFRGPLRQADLPAVLSGHRAYLNLSGTALDRAVVEAMACTVPVVSTNPCVGELFDGTPDADLYLPDAGPDVVAARLADLLGQSPAMLDARGARMRALVVADHSDTALFDKIIGEMKQVVR